MSRQPHCSLNNPIPSRLFPFRKVVWDVFLGVEGKISYPFLCAFFAWLCWDEFLDSALYQCCSASILARIYILAIATVVAVVSVSWSRVVAVVAASDEVRQIPAQCGLGARAITPRPVVGLHAEVMQTKRRSRGYRTSDLRLTDDILADSQAQNYAHTHHPSTAASSDPRSTASPSTLHSPINPDPTCRRSSPWCSAHCHS